MPTLLERTRNIRLVLPRRSSCDHSNNLFSSASELDVRLPLKSSLRSSSASNVSCRKKVRFAEERLNQATRMAANNKMAAVCWFTAAESVSMKAAAQVDVEKVLQGHSELEQSYRFVMSTVFKACQDAEYYECHKKTAMVMSAEDEEHFGKVVAHCGSRLGLEKLSVPYIHQDKVERRKSLLGTMQHVQQALGCRGNMQAEMIRRAVEPITRPNRVFAREMGKAMAASTPSQHH